MNNTWNTLERVVLLLWWDGIWVGDDFWAARAGKLRGLSKVKSTFMFASHRCCLVAAW
jgi:hypothetical protein